MFHQSCLLTYLIFLPGHRALTTIFHPRRSCALCLASPQEIPCVRGSVSRLLLQVVVGRPRLCFPWGFQSSACLVMLVGYCRRVCPTHRHFRSLMVSGIGICCVLLQRSSLEIVSGHLIRRICRRQVFTKTWSFESSALVCFHVSEPYNKTDFTLELKMFSLVLMRMFLLFQTGFRVTKTCGAFPILELMSSSVPPVLLIRLPRQVKL